MIPKIRCYKNSHCTMDKTARGFYIVRLYIGSHLEDKINCDDYRDALYYWKSYNKIAKGA